LAVDRGCAGVAVAGRWLRVGVLLFFSSVYLAMLLQETASGFANPSLWLDHNSRYVLSALMLCFAWGQRRRLVVALAPSGRRFGLDVMRAVAITCVVIAHSTPLFFEEWNSVRDIFKWFIDLGTIGVDIFFCTEWLSDWCDFVAFINSDSINFPVLSGF
jgi:hypothetical protein